MHTTREGPGRGRCTNCILRRCSEALSLKPVFNAHGSSEFGGFTAPYFRRFVFFSLLITENNICTDKRSFEIDLQNPYGLFFH